jgi:hypothetical protein
VTKAANNVGTMATPKPGSKPGASKPMATPKGGKYTGKSGPMQTPKTRGK